MAMSAYFTGLEGRPGAMPRRCSVWAAADGAMPSLLKRASARIARRRLAVEAIQEGLDEWRAEAAEATVYPRPTARARRARRAP